MKGSFFEGGCGFKTIQIKPKLMLLCYYDQTYWKYNINLNMYSTFMHLADAFLCKGICIAFKVYFWPIHAFLFHTWSVCSAYPVCMRCGSRKWPLCTASPHRSCISLITQHVQCECSNKCWNPYMNWSTCKTDLGIASEKPSTHLKQTNK